ncbi:caspase family protein [Fabibacter sp. E12]|nr:caspase family protein [Roseivirga sp. E12]
MNNYEDGKIDNLQGSVHDADSISNWLKKGPVPVDIHSLITDVSNTDMSAFKRVIRKLHAMAWGKVNYRRMYLYFAGHGYSQGHEDFIVFSDANLFYENFASIKIKEVVDFFEYSKGFLEIVVIVDCCRLINRLGNFRHSDFPLKTNRFLEDEDIADLKKKLLAKGTRQNTASLEFYDESLKRHRGRFTRALEMFLDEFDHSQELSTEVLYVGVDEKMRILYGEAQTPKFIDKGSILFSRDHQYRTYPFKVSIKPEYQTEVDKVVIVNGDLNLQADIEIDILDSEETVELMGLIYKLKFLKNRRWESGVFRIDHTGVKFCSRLKRYFYEN